MTPEMCGALARATWTPEVYLARPVVGRCWRATTPMPKRVGHAARAALTDQHVLATTALPPGALARRVAADAEGAALRGADPVHLVRAAMSAPVLTAIYTEAYRAGTGEAPPEGLMVGATVQGVQLLIQGASPVRVQEALQAAASRRVQHVASMYAELAPAAPAPQSTPNFFDMYAD